MPAATLALNETPLSTDDPRYEQGLVARARKGDHEAFREIVERYEGLVAATVIGMLGKGAEAEDVGQSVFVTFYEKLHQYRGEGGLAPYLTRIAVNLSLNALDRRKRQRRRFLSRDAAEHPLPEPPVEAERDIHGRERARLVRRAIDALPPKHRAVVVLRMIDGYSTKETAAMLGVPLGTVLSRLSRAQRRLRELLDPYLREPAPPDDHPRDEPLSRDR